MSNPVEQIRDVLCSAVDPSEYDGNRQYQHDLLEQYKIYHSSVEKVSDRRQAANSFFVATNTALVALVSYLAVGEESTVQPFSLISVSGIAISYMWYRLLRSYRHLNSAKFKVIHEIEKQLPISPYDAEWEAVGRGKDPNKYLPFTYVEVYVPLVFLALHLLAFFKSLPWSPMS